jgi:hypothetical protein
MMKEDLMLLQTKKLKIIREHGEEDITILRSTILREGFDAKERAPDSGIKKGIPLEKRKRAVRLARQEIQAFMRLLTAQPEHVEIRNLRERVRGCGKTSQVESASIVLRGIRMATAFCLKRRLTSLC